MEPSRSSIAKLAGVSNYQVWSIKMKSFLIAQDLWDVVNITASKETETNFQSRDAKALSLIILSCEDHIIRLIDTDSLATVAWRALQKQYGQVGFSARHLAFQSLVGTHIAACSSIDTFIDQFRTNVNTLSQMTSQPLPQWLLLSILINNVSGQFEAWSQAIMQQLRSRPITEETSRYLDEVIASLIDEARRINKVSDIQASTISNTALFSQRNSKPKPICTHCGKIHKSENCWQMFPEKKPTARLSASNNDNPKLSQHYSLNDNIAFHSRSQQESSDSWILDSGATQHMCNDKSQFSNFKPFTTSITIADNTKINATGKGNVRILTKIGTIITLLDVLYVPQLASNLLSISRAVLNPDVRVIFTNEDCRIMLKDKIIATTRAQNSLLILETSRAHAYSSKTVDTLTWHKRLGHVNESYMTKDAVQSIIGHVNKFCCETCLKNKSTRIISRVAPAKSQRPLEKIHSDLAGPITPTSLGGHKYVITFTDDYSRFSWVYLTKEKSNCFEAFKIFKKNVENEFNQKIAFLHCDNGGEYSSNEFKRFAQHEGIQIQYTVPYSPEQNGVSERLNRTLFDMTRCFLNDSATLIKPLWAELVKTSCYIKNRLPSSTNATFKSPFEMLYNRQPTVDHLRIIGSECFCHKTGKITEKLAERSTQCVLVGYESENIFRVFDASTNSVFRCRDVVICEDLQDTTTTVQPNDETHQNHIYTDILPETSNSTPIQNPSSNSIPDNRPLSSIQIRLPIPGQFNSSTMYYTPDNSIDELADPKFDHHPRNARAFVSRCLVATDSGARFIPETLEQAMSCPESQQWGNSMRDEMKSVFDNATWQLVPTPEDGNRVIQGRWVFRTKSDAQGNLVKYKSRWVVKGFQQEEGNNFHQTFASVVKPMSYKILFSIAAAHDLEIEQLDVKTAFLNSPISEDVYVEQPHGFEIASLTDEATLTSNVMRPETNKSTDAPSFPRIKRTNARLVCKLHKALYGLKQAPRAWYKTLAAFMHQSRLEPLKSDYAVFVNPNRTLLVAVYVDDILIFGKNKSQINELKSSFHQRFQMTDIGKAHMYLGMQILRDRSKNTIYLDQQKYLNIVLEKFQMNDCNPVCTPMETGLKLCKRTDMAPPNEVEQYQRLIGCLEYAACATRPDITFAVHTLAQFASNPDVSHFNAAKRILRYLKGSMQFCLEFQGTDKGDFSLLGYTDADWAGSTSDRKSVGGYCFYLNNSLISHISKKQKTIALSTAESETHAAVQATKEAIWLRNILEELGLEQKEPTTLYCDNQAAIALSSNPEYHSRSKHVDIQYHFLRQHVEIGTVALKFTGTDKMAADGLTKPLSRQKHDQFCKFLQGKGLLSK